MIFRSFMLAMLLSLYIGNIDAQLNKSILKEISKLQSNKKDELGIGERFDITRRMLNESDSLFFIKSQTDTIFLLETYDMETSISYGCIWNKSKSLNYIYNQGNKLEFTVEDLFTKYTKKLVSTWDIAEIRKEEKENPGFISRKRIYATRIIISKKSKVDMISFNEFFLFERDAYDQYNLSN